MAGSYFQRIKRQNAALLVAASALGLWLGAAAPAISPVAPAVTVAAPTTSALGVNPVRFHPHHGPR